MEGLAWTVPTDTSSISKQVTATALPTNPATALDKTDEHSTPALYRPAIGGISNDYYLPKFVRYEAADRPGLSWAAAFTTLN
jgi:hypothetical protein